MKLAVYCTVFRDFIYNSFENRYREKMALLIAELRTANEEEEEGGF
jgi:hypothetical protein